MPYINLWAVLVSSIVYVLIGMLWYSPYLFGNEWMRTQKACCGTEDIECCPKSKFVWAFGMALLTCLGLAFIVAGMDADRAVEGSASAFIAWLGIVVPTHYSAVLWEKKPLNLYLIHISMLLIAFVVVGAILGAWV